MGFNEYGVLGHDSAFVRLYWANEMKIVINHAPGTGSLARLVDQHSNALPLLRLSSNRNTYFSEGKNVTHKHRKYVILIPIVKFESQL